jgi:signal transduction histidine kinase
MNSIQKRLIGALLGALALLLLAGGSAVYYSTRALLLRDFDMVLRSVEPEALVNVRNQLREHSGDGREITFELNETLAKSGVYVEAWTPEGKVLARSGSLEGGDLPFPGTPPSTGLLWQDSNASNLGRVRALALNLDSHIREPDAYSVSGPGNATSPEIAAREKEKAALEMRLGGLPKSVVLAIARNRTELDATLRRLSRVLWITGLLMVFLTAPIVTTISRRGLAPLERVGEQAARIDASKLGFRFPTEDLPLELQSICGRLNDLLARLETSFARERCFSADVAHELRTPITELRALAEIALKWPSSDPVVTGAFRDALDAVLQMQIIVDGLLTISRCESGIQMPVAGPVAMPGLVRRSWQPFETRAAEKRLRVQFDLSDDVFIQSDGGMLALILTNLFSNAVEYAPREGRVQLQLRNNGHLEFNVANSVENISAEDLPHFFERFWRKDAARSSSEHSGIGLSVSRACARVLGLELEAALPANGWLMMRLSNQAKPDEY